MDCYLGTCQSASKLADRAYLYDKLETVRYITLSIIQKTEAHTFEYINAHDVQVLI